MGAASPWWSQCWGLTSSDQAGGIEHGVVDDDAGSLVWGALSEVELLRLDVATHAGVLGIRNRAVARRHPLRGHLERRASASSPANTVLPEPSTPSMPTRTQSSPMAVGTRSATHLKSWGRPRWGSSRLVESVDTWPSSHRLVSKPSTRN